MNKYRFSNALGYTFEQLAEMHNASFSGYFVPISMTAAQIADFWRINQINATRCVVMHDENGDFVGLARMGTRGTRGWCGGFGITPAFRGSGASKLLANEMVRVARESGLTLLQLEVLSQNSRARKLYEQVGFVVHRRLFGLEIATSALPTSSSPSLPTENISAETLLSRFQQRSHQPCWNLEAASVLTANTEAFVASGPDGHQNAVIVQRIDDKIRVQAVLLQGQFTDEAFAALLRTAAADATMIQVYNEPEESPLLQRYLALGFTEYFSQDEMLLKL